MARASAMTTATFALPAPTARDCVAGGALAGRGFAAYLVLVALLAPFVVPPGPAQLALLDVLNLAALATFAAVVLVRRVPIVLPFAVPLLVVAVGSLLAVTNAVSVGASVLALAQDAYLYLWFVALVALMSRQGDLRGFRLAWLVIADVVALVCLVQAAQGGAFPGQLLSAAGFRPAGTFYGPNMCADYLVLSMFVGLSLWGRSGRVLLFGSLALLLVALLATKSNGSLVSLVAGGAAAVIVWAARREGSPQRRLGVLALLAAAGVLGVWAWSTWDVGARLGRGVGEGTVLGRMEKSSAGRKAIWGQLGSQLTRHPLGIGPGNSVLQSVEIGHRVRTGTSLQSKEAHSDYIAYAVERGPIGLLGHLLWVVAGIVFVLGARTPAGDRARARRLDLLRALFVGGLIASAVHSVVIEKLHFRHYWMFLALACAVTAGEKFRTAGEPGGRERAVLRPGGAA